MRWAPRTAHTKASRRDPRSQPAPLDPAGHKCPILNRELASGIMENQSEEEERKLKRMTDSKIEEEEAFAISEPAGSYPSSREHASAVRGSGCPLVCLCLLRQST